MSDGFEGNGSPSVIPYINPIYSQLLDNHQEMDSVMAGYIAYGVYKQSKREWVADFWRRNERKPNDQELSEYTRTWTPSRLQGLRDEANQALAEYAADVVAIAEPQLRHEAIEGAIGTAVEEIKASTKLTWAKIRESLVLSMAGAAIYTVILIVIAVGLRFAGVDLLGVEEKVNEAVATSPKNPGT